MKIKYLIKTLLTAALLTTAPSQTQAASLLADGTFDNLPAGTAPDRNTPAGRWFWPANYLLTSDGKDFSESSASQVTIVPAPGGGGGNALHYSFTASDPDPGMVLPNILARQVTAASGEILTVSFDIYVTPGRGGADIFLSNGRLLESQFGPYLRWRDNGKLYFLNSQGFLALFDYPRGVWQTLRLKIDMARSRFDLEWSERGQPVSLTRTNMTFPGVPPYIDRLEIARGQGEDVNAFLDNFQVSAGASAAVVPDESIVFPGGSVTLSLTNTLAVPSSYQWQFHGTNLPGATSSNLILNNLTLDQTGPYSVVVSNAFEVVTATAGQVEVATQLTLLSQPQSTNAPVGSNVTLRVTAVSPLPITYQWQFNGVDLANQTNAALALTNVQFYPQTGDYRVQVSDTASNGWSDVAALLVLQRPVITNQPVAQTVLQGGTAVFSVTAGPDHPLLPLSYRWLRSGLIFLSNAPAMLVLTNVQPGAAGTFRVVVTNLAGSVNSATASLTVLADFDGDGVADAWEKQYGFDTNHLADATLDFDGDGMSNRDEYNAGTNPTNAASVLKLQLSPVVAGQAALSFLAMSNRTYTVEWNAAATGGTWNRVQDVLAQPAERIESVSDTNASGAMRLYRVVTPKRP